MASKLFTFTYDIKIVCTGSHVHACSHVNTWQHQRCISHPALMNHTLYYIVSHGPDTPLVSSCWTSPAPACSPMFCSCHEARTGNTGHIESRRVFFPVPAPGHVRHPAHAILLAHPLASHACVTCLWGSMPHTHARAPRRCGAASQTRPHNRQHVLHDEPSCNTPIIKGPDHMYVRI